MRKQSQNQNYWKSEQGILKLSIFATAGVALYGIVFGVLSGSFSIAFDGFYALLDGVMSWLALMVARAILAYSSEPLERPSTHHSFNMGYWHLEPMVLGLNSALLMGAGMYALITAIGNLLEGGRHLHFDWAILYAVVTVLVCTVMAVAQLRVNRRLRSSFVEIDAKSWIMSGGITSALLVAFVFGSLIEGTHYAWMAPYIDPAVLALVCIVIIPLPYGTLKRAFSDILLITPHELRKRVDTIARAALQTYGFSDYRAYVARVGRLQEIELHFIAPPEWPIEKLEKLDDIRAELEKTLGAREPDRWLTIAFTTDVKWAA
jgi:predicted Co/Zn/Cd cation transporter (cation efflux family)